MQAVFSSKMALTDAFVSRQDTMQILVTIGTGKTITVNEIASTEPPTPLPPSGEKSRKRSALRGNVATG